MADSTSLLLENAYRTYLKQWYAQSHDPDIVLWRKYVNPSTDKPREILIGSTVSIVKDDNYFKVTPTGPTTPGCSVSKWNVKQTQIAHPSSNLPTASVPMSMRWLVKEKNATPFDIKTKGIPLTGLSSIFFHPTAGIIYSINTKYASLSPATSVSQPLTPTGVLPFLENSNSVMVDYELKASSSVSKISEGSTSTFNFGQSIGGANTVFSFWFYISSAYNGSMGTISLAQPLNLVLQSNILKLNQGTTTLYELNGEPNTWTHIILYTVATPGTKKKSNGTTIKILENGIPCKPLQPGTLKGSLKNITLGGESAVYVGTPSYCITTGLTNLSTISDITGVLQNNTMLPVSLGTPTTDTISPFRVKPPPLWVGTNSVQWLDVVDALSSSECQAVGTSLQRECSTQLHTPGMYLSATSKCTTNTTTAWKHTWKGATGGVSIWVQFSSPTTSTHYTLYIKETGAAAWSKLAISVAAPSSTSSTSSQIVWSSAGNTSMQSGKSYYIALLLTCNPMVPVTGVLLSAGDVSTINYKNFFVTNETTATATLKRYRYVTIDQSNCSVTNPYTGQQSESFSMNSIAPQITEQFLDSSLCPLNANCGMFTFTTPAASMQIKINRKIVSVEGIISFQNYWYVIATFAQQLTPNSVTNLLTKISVNDFQTYEYREAFFAATGIFYTKADNTKTLLQKKLSSEIKVQFLIKLNVLPTVNGVTVPFTVASFESISTVFPSIYNNIAAITKYSYISDRVLIIDNAGNLISYNFEDGNFLNGTYISTNSINTLPLTEIIKNGSVLNINSVLGQCVALVPSASDDMSLVASTSSAAPVTVSTANTETNITWGSTVTLTSGTASLEVTLMPEAGYMPKKAPAPSSFNLANFKTKVTAECNVSNAFVTESGTRGKELCSNMVNIYLATTLEEYKKQQQMQKTASPSVINLLKKNNRFQTNTNFEVTYNSDVDYVLDNQYEVQTSGGETYTVGADGLQPSNLMSKIIWVSVAAGILVVCSLFAFVFLKYVFGRSNNVKKEDKIHF